MSAYLIVQADVSDWKQFKQYVDVVPAIVQQYGGEYIVVGGQPELLEGDQCAASTVISKWPDKQTAKEFWHSDEYQQAAKLREGTGTFDIVLVDGIGE